MGLFGKKNNDNDNNGEEIKDVSMLEGADLDALIMSAIEETDLEQAQELNKETLLVVEILEKALASAGLNY